MLATLLSRQFLDRYGLSLLGATAVLWQGISPQSGGLVLIVCSLFMLPYRLLRLLLSYKQPAVQLKKIMLWTVVLGSLFILQYAYAQQRQSVANKVAAALHQYQQQHGQYPVEINTLSQEHTINGRPIIYYSLSNEGQPFLFYRSNWTGYGRYFYHFDNREWEYKHD